MATDAAPVTEDEVARVAGVALRAPSPAYSVEGLSFGRATLTRDERAGTLSGATLELSLTPEAVASVVGEGGADVASVAVPVGTFHLSARYEDDEEDALGDGLRDLLVEHQLLVRPALLDAEGEPPGETITGSATRTLTELRRRHASFVSAQAQGAPCAACRVVQEQSQERRFEAEVRAKREALGARLKGVTDRTERATAEKEFSEWEWETRWKYRNEGSFASCPHAPMTAEAWRAITTEHPEVAFELVGLLVPEPESQPPRFTLAQELVRKVLGAWLVGRARDTHLDFGRVFRSATASSRWTSRRTNAHQFSVRRSELSEEIPAEVELGLRFAASAWDTPVPPARLYRDPAREVSAPAPSLSHEVMPEEGLNVPRLIPSAAVKPADASSKKPAPKKKPAKA